MASRIDHIELLIDRLRALMPDDVDAKEYLTELVYDRLDVGNRSQPMGPMGVVGRPGTDQEVAAASLQAIENLDQPALLADLPHGLEGLTHLVWEIRPALPLQDGDFEPLEVGTWANLSGDLVQEHAQSVCRIDLCTNGQLYRQLGTGFVVSADAERLLIMTNAHVVDAALETGWTVLPELTVTCDFARYSVLSGGTLLPLTEQYEIHAQQDLALLTLPRDGVSGEPLPKPLPIAADVEDDGVGLMIGVIGHPALNTQVDGLFPKFYGFGDAFGVKRFSPGYLRGRTLRTWYKRYPTIDASLHDATTLGGSSGSCLVRLDTLQVAGLHFGGWPMLAKTNVDADGQSHFARLFYDNGAVPLWTLVHDPMLEQVNFQQ